MSNGPTLNMPSKTVPGDGVRRARVAKTALAVAVLAAIAGTAAFLVTSRLVLPVPMRPLLVPEQFEEEGWDTRAQLAGHSVAIVVCAGLAAAMALLGHRHYIRARLRGWSSIVLGAGAAAAIGLFFLNFQACVHYFRTAAPWVGVSVVVIAAALGMSRFIGPRAMKVTNFLIVGLVILFIVPGLLIKHDLTISARPLSLIEAHFSVMPGSAGRLAAGLKPFTEVTLWYGAILPVLFGIIERAVGALSLGQYMSVIQVMQILFLAMAVIAYRRWKPGDPWYLGACLFLILPWLQTTGPPLHFPNLSAWRLMNLAGGVLVLIALRHAGNRSRAIWFGAVAAFAILFNAETGFALSIAYVVDIVLSHRSRALGGLARTFAVAVASAAGTVLLIAAAGRLGLGSWPVSVRVVSEQFAVVGGFGGRPLNPSLLNVIALGMFLHASAVLVCSAVVWTQGKLSTDGVVKASIATYLLIWMRYFVNRPTSGWSLWGVIFLYSFLIGDYFAAARRIFSPRRSGRDLVLLAFGFVCIVPFSARAARADLRQNLDALLHANYLSSDPSSAGIWSGVRVEKGVASMLEEKVQFLREQPSDVIYFAPNSFTIAQASRRYPRLPVQDPYFEAALWRDYDRLVAAVAALEPQRILFEPEASPLFFSPQQKRLLIRIKNDVTQGYAFGGLLHGWEVWNRVPAEPGLVQGPWPIGSAPSGAGELNGSTGRESVAPSLN